MRTALLVALLVVVCSSIAFACPASYVHGQGQNNGHPHHKKASDVADGYMTNRGVDPNSPAGQSIKPYVTGTGIVEFSWSQNFKPNKSVDELVGIALGSYAGQQPEDTRNDSDNQGHGYMPTHEHFNLHFGYGWGEANQSPPQVTTDKKGG